MKGFRRTLIILAGIFIFIGIAIVSVGGVLAAKNNVDLIGYFTLGDTKFESEEFDMDEEKTMELSDIKEIDLTGNYGKVEFVKGDRFAYKVYGNEVDSTLFTHDVVDGVWKINIKNRSGFYFFGMGSDDHISKLVVTVPSTEILDKVNIKLSAGTVQVERLAAKDMSIEMGAGDLTATELVAEESSYLSVSAGRCQVKNMIAKNPKFVCEAGQIVTKGILTGTGSIKCGVGHIDLDVVGNASDYDYKAKCGVGGIKIDGSSIGGFGSKNDKNTGCANSFDMKCGVGQIELNFVIPNN